MSITKLEDGIKGIAVELTDVIEEAKSIMNTYSDIIDHLEEIKCIEEGNFLDIGIDYDEIEVKAINTCIFNNEYIVKLLDSIDYLIEELQEWGNDCSNEEKMEIQEFYIEALNEVRGKIDPDKIYEYEDLEKQLVDMSKCLLGIMV